MATTGFRHVTTDLTPMVMLVPCTFMFLRAWVCYVRFHVEAAPLTEAEVQPR